LPLTASGAVVVNRRKKSLALDGLVVVSTSNV